MPSETEALVRDVLEWFLGRNLPDNRALIDRWVADYLVHRANQAMAEGVPRYVPVDGHDWHEESPATTPRSDRAAGREEGSIAPTG